MQSKTRSNLDSSEPADPKEPIVEAEPDPAEDSPFTSFVGIEVGKKGVVVSCPDCDAEITTDTPVYLRCKSCDLRMFVDEEGYMVWHEGDKEECPKCGHKFRSEGKMEFPTEFDKIDRKVRTFFSTVEKAVDGLLK